MACLQIYRKLLPLATFQVSVEVGGIWVGEATVCLRASSFS